MRVLDLDLDFFLDGLCDLAEAGHRPVGASPVDERDVRAFLERNLRLSRARPVPGRVFLTHDGSLCAWEDWIRAGRLAPPFHVTHVDAHSDLGIGRPGPGYVLYNLLSRPVESRRDLAEHYRAGQLDEANYLLFAAAMRRLSSLDDVRRPFSLPDIPREILCGSALRLVSPFQELFLQKTGAEPPIPFYETKDPASYRADAEYDFVTLAQSPRYAPECADGVMRVIREYIREE